MSKLKKKRSESAYDNKFRLICQLVELQKVTRIPTDY